MDPRASASRCECSCSPQPARPQVVRHVSWPAAAQHGHTGSCGSRRKPTQLPHHHGRCSACQAAAQRQDGAAVSRTTVPDAAAVPESWAGREPAATDNVLLERNLDIGRLTVARMAPSELGAAAVIVTRAFAGTPEAQPLRDIREYIETLVEDPAESLVLVARLQPAGGAEPPGGGAARVAGIAMLSFVRDTREQFQTLQPPDEAAYLSNTAIDAAFRRKGVARALLAACEDASRNAGAATLTLHVRLADDAALQLYSSAGFREVDRDATGWAPFRRYRPRALMAKQL